MTVSVIIPAYNNESLLEKNLPMVLLAAKNKKNNIIEVIVVDDASTDGSYNLVKNKFPEVRIIRHKVNRGFSASVNTGVRSAKGELLCLLNTDVVPQVSFLETVYPLFENLRLFATSLNEEGQFSWARALFRNGFIEHEPGVKSESTHNTFWVSGGSGVFRHSIWVRLGGLDEKLLSPFYWEDLDICYRALKRGYKLLWDPSAKVRHEHESTISHLSKNYVGRIRERNQLLFIWKNLTSANMFRKHLVGLIKRVLKNPGYLRIVIMAMLNFAVVIKARGKEKRESKVSDEAIFSSFK